MKTFIHNQLCKYNSKTKVFLFNESFKDPEYIWDVFDNRFAFAALDGNNCLESAWFDLFYTPFSAVQKKSEVFSHLVWKEVKSK